MSDSIIRPQVPENCINEAFSEILMKLVSRLDEKGYGTFASSHEIDGVVDEEVREWKDAVRSNDANAQYKELLDIAVACVFGLACYKFDKMSWR